MKTIKALLITALLTASTTVLSQTDTNNPPVSTNNLSVVLRADQDATLKDSWQYDAQLRTNGLPPYTNVTAEITFKKYLESVSAEGLEIKAKHIRNARESEMVALWRKASVNKQNKALKALQ